MTRTRTILPAYAVEPIDDALLRWSQDGSMPSRHIGTHLIATLNLSGDWLLSERERIANVLTSRQLLERQPDGPVADRIRAALRDELLPDTIKSEIESIEFAIGETIRKPLIKLGEEICRVINSLSTATDDERETLLNRFEQIQLEQWSMADVLDDLSDEIEQLRNRYL